MLRSALGNYRVTRELKRNQAISDPVRDMAPPLLMNNRMSNVILLTGSKLATKETETGIACAVALSSAFGTFHALKPNATKDGWP